jgi:hypothetical protein
MCRKSRTRLAFASLVLGFAATCLALPRSVYTSEEKGDYRYITANGLPNHAAGQFPNAHNPNTIREQKYAFRLSLHPVANPNPTPVRRYLFGVALNGVVLDPGTAEFWRNDRRSGWNIEAIAPPGVRTINLGLDKSNAHVQPSGAYHYHADPTGLIESLTAGRQGANHGKTMIQIGWAADGFPIYDHHGYAKADDAKSELKELKSSYRLKKGNRPGLPDGPGGPYDGVYTQDYEYVEGAGDLDECNGRRGVTPEFPSGTYYYVITYEFPYISRLFRGTPDETFAHPAAAGPGGPRPGGPGGPGGPAGPFGPGRGRPPGPPPGPGAERP